MQHERLAHPQRQARQQTVDALDGLAHQGQVFFRGAEAVGQQSQLLQVGALQATAAPQVTQQMARHGGQEGPGLLQLWQLLRAQSAHERVLGQVGGILRAVQLAIQPAAQPAVVVAVERGEQGVGV